MADRSHLSIGEVLSLLREEFPDVTISKIRFLESQGLVDPERTPSGYRKFYDRDVDRLRWILRQQRENFLPLKVIKDKLSERDDRVTERDNPGEPRHPAEDTAPVLAVPTGVASTPSRSAEPADTLSGSHSGRSGVTATERTRPAPPPTPSLFAELHREREASGAPGQGARATASPDGGAGESYTLEELARLSGADAALVEDLKQFGLLSPERSVGSTQYFDESAVAIARAATEFSRHGVEVRHLRVWRNSADREADLFQQVVMPLLRQRNPQARQEALDTLEQLAKAGSALRDALLSRALRDVR
jgi:DNA-binding transcriptional MerR regulator